MLEEFPHIHTGRELELMLSQKKPLARFSEAEACLPNEEFIPEKAFSEYVESGVFVREQFEIDSKVPDRKGNFHTIKYVLFALPAETWRIEAMRILITEHQKTGQWNETCERIEGKLLGYTEEENDIWCNRRRSKISET